LFKKGGGSYEPPPFFNLKIIRAIVTREPTGLKSKWLETGAVFVVLVSITGFCQELVFNSEVPFYRDLTNYFYPLRYSLWNSFRVGELGLWNRHFAQGFPALASFQIGVFYPPHWVLLILPFYESIRVLFICHFLLAGFGTYVLLRSWNYSRDLAIVGALLFSLGGMVVSLTNLLNHFQSAVWLPWLLVSWERLLVSQRWRSFVGFSLVAAMQFLAGSPEIAALSMFLALVKGLTFRQSETQASWSRIFGLAIAGNMLMLSLTMIQILPTVELISESRRGHSIPASESFMWSLEPISLLNLFLPDSEVDRSIGVGIIYYFGRKIPLFLTMYLGLISLYGIALWIYYGTRREKVVLSFLALMSLVLALGNNTLVYPFLLQHIPSLSAIRFPEKFFFIAYAVLILISINGLRSFLMDDSMRIRGAILILSGICLGWTCLYLYLNFRSEILSNFILAGHGDAAFSKGISGLTVAVLTNLQRQVILSFGIVGLLFLIKADKIGRGLFSTLLIALVYVDLTWAHSSFLFPMNPSRLLSWPSIIEPAHTHQTRLFYYPSLKDLHPAYFTVRGQPTFEQAVALSFQNYLPNVGTVSGIDYFQEIDALGRRGYSDFLRVANGLTWERQIKLLGIFNVKYLVSFYDLPETDIRLVRRFPQYFSWLYELKSVVPRTYLVKKFTIDKDPVSVLRRLSDSRFNPLEEVVLDSEVSLPPSGAFVGKAEIQRYDDNDVQIVAAANGESILVLTDSFYPGWKAYVDGQDSAIFRANHFYRAVRIPAGEHKVEFRYEPWSFRIGAMISLATLFLITATSIVVLMRQWKRARLPIVNSAEMLEA